MHFQCPECDTEGKTEKDVRKNGCKCKIMPLQMLDPVDHKESKSEKKKEQDENKKLYDFALKHIKKLVISESNTNDVYAVIESNSHIEAISLSSSRAVHWLNYEYTNSINSAKLHSNDFYKTVLNTIIAKAQMNGTLKEKIYNRVAQLKDEIWYDLGTLDRKAIKITLKGVHLLKLDASSPIFRRSQSLQEQVRPEKDNEKALDDLCNLLHISTKDRILFKTNLVALFLESYPIPMIVFDGSVGSFKTTATASVKKIIDPSGRLIEDNVSTMAKNPQDLIIQLYNRYLSCFDNVSNINQEVSDILCRAITGSSNQKRKLYTDDDESIQSFRRKIAMNGIVPNLEYPDLQSRLIKIDRDIIDEKHRLTEREFNERFDNLLPNVLGQIFLILFQALSWYKSLKFDIKPKTRMSDFEVWGEIISRIMGYKENQFLQVYYEKLKEETLSSQDSYPLVAVITNFMQDKKVYEDSTSNIYNSLQIVAENLGIDLKAKYTSFSRGSNKLKKHLKIVEPMLKTNLISLEYYNYTKNDGKFTKNASIIKITHKESQARLKF